MPWVAFWACLPRVEEKTASTNIQKGNEPLSDCICVCFFTLWKRRRMSAGLVLFWGVMYRPVPWQTCGLCELLTVLHQSFCSSFLFKLGLMGFFFKCWKAHCSSCLPSPSRNKKANIWKKCCLKDVSCPPWKCVDIGRHPECHVPVCRGGMALGLRYCAWDSQRAPHSCWNQHLPPLCRCPASLLSSQLSE